jgi:hypothetical protein
MPETFTHVYSVINNSIYFACPECAYSKRVDVERFLQRDKQARIKIRCKCHAFQTAVLDRRGSRRKTTDIRGSYFFAPKGKPIIGGEISIKNLSFSGLGFNLLSVPKGAFAAGDVLRVHFKLFQTSRLLIKKEAVVKQTDGSRVNATFREPLKIEDDFLLKLFFYT